MTTLDITEKLNETLNFHDEFEIMHRCEDADEKYFAKVIGSIEEIIMDEYFQDMQKEFMEKHWLEFEDIEENKLVYTDIFTEYISKIEKYIEKKLLIHIPEFCMARFEKELQLQKQDFDGEIFEILSTFYDFNSFKRMFLDYKAVKEGKIADFSLDISVSKLNFSGNNW